MTKNNNQNMLIKTRKQHKKLFKIGIKTKVYITKKYLIMI